jgi:hypothetical protein
MFVQLICNCDLNDWEIYCLQVASLILFLPTKTQEHHGMLRLIDGTVLKETLVPEAAKDQCRLDKPL